MAKGNRIVINIDAKGRHDEYLVKSGETHYPGMLLEEDPTADLVGGKNQFKIYSPGSDGGRPRGRVAVVTERLLALQGKTMTDSYTDRGSLYFPQPGDELNLLIKNLAGTGDSHAAGEVIIPNTGTGKWIATTGTPVITAQLKETLAALTADTLAWAGWGGY